MSLINIPNIFTVGAVIVASQHNSNFSVIYSDYDGNIDDTNLAASANISDTKLAQIVTAGKVSGAALTSLSSTPSGAGILPGANTGLFSGIIVMWSGTIATIPTGWYLCNGSNSTPDLRNLFIVGADADVSSVAKSTITGSALQTHTTGIVGNHTHTMPLYSSNNGGNSGVPQNTPGPTDSTSNATNTNTSGNAKNIAPFYALAFIMKS